MRQHELTAALLRCRSWGHAWDDIPATRRPPYGHFIWLRCERCHTQREDIVDVMGDLRNRRYVRPAGYAEAKCGLTVTEARSRVLVDVRRQARERARGVA